MSLKDRYEQAVKKASAPVVTDAPQPLGQGWTIFYADKDDGDRLEGTVQGCDHTGAILTNGQHVPFRHVRAVTQIEGGRVIAGWVVGRSVKLDGSLHGDPPHVILK